MQYGQLIRELIILEVVVGEDALDGAALHQCLPDDRFHVRSPDTGGLKAGQVEKQIPGIHTHDRSLELSGAPDGEFA